MTSNDHIQGSWSWKQFETNPESPKRIESRDNDLLALLLKRVQNAEWMVTSMLVTDVGDEIYW